MQNRGAQSTLLIEFPQKLWIGKLSREFQSLQFSIQTFIPISHQPYIGNSLVSITGPQISAFLGALQKEETLLNYEVMKLEQTQLVLKTETKDKILLKALISNHILVQFPVSIHNGCATMHVLGQRNNIDQFISNLEQYGVVVELQSIGSFELDPFKNRLTSRQFEVFKKAQELGYYEMPRQINLTELADELGVAKSSLSEMIQRIHKNIMGSNLI